MQVTGQWLSPSGQLLATGYSGCPACKNNPETQSQHNEGPIPVGKYQILPPVQHTVTHGDFVLPLNPDFHNLMFGRAGFLVHGDSRTDPGTASEGCIILPRMAREAIWASGDHQLQVISGVLSNGEEVSDAAAGAK